MKKITMFVEDLSDDYQLIPFYPVIENQNKLKDQLHNTGIDGFKNGVERTIQFIKDKYPQAYNQIDADIDDDEDDDEYEVPETVEPPKNELIPQGNGTVGTPVKSSIEASDIIVTPDGCIINKRFLPADILLAAASAVHEYQQMENE